MSSHEQLAVLPNPQVLQLMPARLSPIAFALGVMVVLKSR
jgi:hypothetical protein